MLTFSIILNLKSNRTDFSNVFDKLDMEGPPVCTDAPYGVPGFKQLMNFLQLKKSLYGQVVRFSQDTVYQDQDGIR